jgi:oxalate decarboxylase/phosphoglucose isomerase-like protein (cupin superfamily)
MKRAVRQVHLDGGGKDERGWVVDLMKILLPQHVLGGGHLASLQPGAVRGNHFHRDATEWLMIFGGKARMLWKEAEGGSVQEEVVAGMEPVLFEIPPGVAHAIENTSSREIYLIALYDRPGPGVFRVDGLLPGRRE